MHGKQWTYSGFLRSNRQAKFAGIVVTTGKQTGEFPDRLADTAAITDANAPGVQTELVWVFATDNEAFASLTEGPLTRHRRFEPLKRLIQVVLLWLCVITL